MMKTFTVEIIHENETLYTKVVQSEKSLSFVYDYFKERYEGFSVSVSLVTNIYTVV
jgi:hypothetical protein